MSQTDGDMSLIEKLTPEQEALIRVYREKWRSIALSIEPIDHQKATEAVKAAYKLIGKQEPEIVFFDSPYAFLNSFPPQLDGVLGDSYEESVINYILDNEIAIAFSGSLYSQLETQVEINVRIQLEREFELCLLSEQRCERLNSQMWDEMYDKLIDQLGDEWNGMMSPSDTPMESYLPYEAYKQLDQILGIIVDFTSHPEILAADYGFFFDFCISVLNCAHDARRWDVFQALTQSCGWLIPLEQTCIVCDRLLSFSYDSNYRLHAEEKPAIQFADGYSLYAHHGVTIPEKYGLLATREWQASWLLEEENAEVRRVLIQGIGYARVCQELQAEELDFWAEYTLLKIDIDVDGAIEQEEPIYLLKMTCPSTRAIHVLRVPPNIQSAREAIRWVNWGIEPEKFLMQT